jgi:hypothetical protein
MRAITDTRQYVDNTTKGKANETIPPDRFAPISGVNNYRSGTIKSFNQLKMLRDEYGIKTVVNLALDSMDHQKDGNFNCGGRRVPCEPLWAEALGMEYYPFYLTKYKPDAERWEIIKQALSKGNTLIHCTHGVDRTGAVAAAWRKTTEPDLSEQEMLDYTYSFGGAWKKSSDPNRHLRAWITSDEVLYDPKVAFRTRLGIHTPKIFGGAVVLALLVAGTTIVMNRNKG